jgi:hypothetical protein
LAINPGRLSVFVAWEKADEQPKEFSNTTLQPKETADVAGPAAQLDSATTTRFPTAHYINSPASCGGSIMTSCSNPAGT